MNNKEEKSKKKKLRGLLILFFKKLKGKCGTFKKAEEWDKFIKENLIPLIRDHEEVIPTDWKDKLHKAYKLEDGSKSAIDAACKLLQKQLKGLIKYLPKGGFFANPLIKMVLGVAAGGGIIATVLNVSAVTIKIKNNGCETIYPSAYSVIRIPGLQLPQNPIVSGGEGIAKLPPVIFSVDMSGDTVKFTALGINLNFQLISPGIDLIFNGNSLIGKRNVIALSGKKEHELLVICR